MNKKIIASVLAVAFAFSMAGPVGAITDAEYQNLLDQFNQLTALYNTLLAQISGSAASATAVCFNTDLQYGMTSDSVKDLQIKLGVTPTSGYFGPITKAAVKTFQTSNGIINTGYVGPLTRGALNALYCTPVVPSTTYPAGCTSAVGYSTTTGLPCSGEVVSYPEGCTSAVGYSPTTGLSCAGTTTTTVAVPAYGTLSVVSYPVSNPQTNLYGGSTYELLAGQYKATGSDITLKKVALQIVDNDTTTFPWQVFTTISLWDGSTKLAEVIPTEANMIKNTFAHDYTLDISGFNLVISKDTQKVLTVKGTIMANPVAAVTANDYDITLLKASVVYSDTAGVTYTSASGNDVSASDFKILASQVAGKTISLATDNPLAGNVIISSSGTTKVDVLKFNVKVTDVNTTFSTGVIKVETGENALFKNSYVTSLELWDGGTLVAAAAPSGWTGNVGTSTWSNFTLPVSAGTTKTFTVKAVLAQVASTYVNTAGAGYLQITTQGPKLTGIDANSNVVTVDGGTSVIGNKLYPFLSAPTFVFGSQSVTVKNSSNTALSDIGDTAITFSVTAGGVNDIYIPMAKAATVTAGMSETLTGSATATKATTWSCNSPATEDPFAAEYLYRISSGQTANCTFSTLVDNTIASSTSAYMSVALTGVKWYDSATSTANSFISQTWGFTNIKTVDFYLKATNP